MTSPAMLRMERILERLQTPPIEVGEAADLALEYRSLREQVKGRLGQEAMMSPAAFADEPVADALVVALMRWRESDRNFARLAALAGIAVEVGDSPMLGEGSGKYASLVGAELSSLESNGLIASSAAFLP